MKYKGVASLFSAWSPSLPDRKSRSQPQIIDDYSEHSLTKCAAKPMNNSTIEYNSKLHSHTHARASTNGLGECTVCTFLEVSGTYFSLYFYMQ